jgi:pyruvate formate lyase activating enzyme
MMEARFKALLQKEAGFYRKLGQGAVQCELCRRYCAIREGEAGKCGVRKNAGGKLYSLVYGRTVSMEIDPIEKKPLFHFKPGSHCMGISTFGCNFFCLHCFSPDTNVLTGEGIRRIEDLFGVGAPLAEEENVSIRKLNGLEVVTQRGDLSELVHGFRHSYEGELLEIKPFYLPSFKCTPNHKIFIETKEGEHSSKTAAELKEGDLLLIPREFSSKQKVIDLAEVFKHHVILFKKNAWKYDLKRAEEIFSLYSSGSTSKELGEKFDMHPVYVRHLISKIREHGFPFLFEQMGGIEVKGDRVRFKFSKSEVPRFIEINPDFAKLLGYYCAEGHVGFPGNRPTSYYLRFSFGKHETKYVKEVQRLVSRVFGLSSSISPAETTLNVVVGNSPIALLFKFLAGSGAKNKSIPSEILFADRKTIKAFLAGYVAGDGWVGREIISMSSVSESLAVGLCGLLLKVGAVPRFYVWNPSPRKKIVGRTISQSQLYYVKVKVSNPERFLQEADYREAKGLNKKCIERDNYFLIPIKQIKKYQYRGPVYNLEVKGEHSYLASFAAVANCQNWQTSQQRSEAAIASVPFTSPEEIVEQTLASGTEGIAYTYTEPTIFAEYALDTMRLAKKKGLYNVWVSNGYMTKKCIDAIAPFLDAINVDLKGDSRFYREVCGNANVEFVKENIASLFEKKIHVEVTNLIVPGYNDNEKSYKEASDFVASVSPTIPLHFTRFWPQYKMQHLPPTDVEKLRRAKETALKAGVKYAYIGNVGEEEPTLCSKCSAVLVKRLNLTASVKELGKNGKCKKCGSKADIIV